MTRNVPPEHKPNVEDLFKNKLMTFEDIDRLSIQQFKKGQPHVFKPSDVIDQIASDDDNNEDEILNKF